MSYPLQKIGDVEDASQRHFADGHGDGISRSLHFHAALEPFRAAHRDRANPAVAHVLLRFEDELAALSVDVECNLQRLVDLRELAGRGKVHVHDRTDDLDDIAEVAEVCGGFCHR